MVHATAFEDATGTPLAMLHATAFEDATAGPGSRFICEIV